MPLPHDFVKNDIQINNQKITTITCLHNLMRFIFLVALLTFSVFQAQSQTVAQSIFAEYGYPNIPEDSTAIFTMFGYSKYRLYADDKFVQIETFQDLPAEQLQGLGAGLRSVFVKERASGDVFICVTLDSLRIRMKGGEKEQASFREVTETFNSGSAAVYGKGSKKIDIQGYGCEQYLVKGAFRDTVPAYLTRQVTPGPAIKDYPLYVSGGGQDYGLMLGRDEVLWNDYTLEFRALAIEINKPRDVAVELASYRLVTEEEGDKLIKEWFEKLMTMPVEGKN